MNSNSMDFLKEAAIMHSISHPNIVKLYGVVLGNCNSLMLVTELAPLKSLLDCLKDATTKFNFTVSSLCDFAFQICDGMQYLEKNQVIHRDLAARNILVFKNNLVKISDFGLSRALGVGGKDYYQMNFDLSSNRKLPIAWCAPECINYLKFTSSSDVWAFAVTLWELFSYGYENPWKELDGKQILEAIDEPNFKRLEQPDCCPKDYYTLIMLKCWEHEPLNRPKFSEIIKILPDCKPELVQAVKDSSLFTNSLANDQSNANYLQFKTGDIITVLDKSSINLNEQSIKLKHTLWKGCSNNGKTGLFNPNLTISYLGKNLPNCDSSSISPTNTHNNNTHSSNLTQNGMKLSVFIKSFLDKTSGSNDKSNKDGNCKKKIKPDMISKPQGKN